MTDIAKDFEDSNSAIFAQAVRYARLPLTIADPNMTDSPIVFANDAFCDLVGYDRTEIIGHNCRFLQGAETTPESIDQVRKAIASEEVSIIEIVNYRKDGSKFVNALQIGPIYDEDGKLKHYFGSQIDITAMRESEAKSKRLAEEELRHRLLNIVSVLAVVVRLTAREDLTEAEKLDRIDERVAAVGKAHLMAMVNEHTEPLSFRHLAEVILGGYTPRDGKNLVLDGPDLALGSTALTSLSLVLHELATNAVKHGAFGDLDGCVTLTWAIEPGEDGRTALALKWVESGGPVVETPTRESGSKMVADVFRASGGSLVYDWQPTGLVATAILPLT